MAQNLYLDYGRAFFQLGPSKPSSIKLNLYDLGQLTTEYSGCDVTAVLYNGMDQKKEYVGTVSGSVLTLNINKSFPGEAGIYNLELFFNNISDSSSSEDSSSSSLNDSSSSIAGDSSSSITGDSSSSSAFLEEIDEVFEGWCEVLFSRKKRDTKKFTTQSVKRKLDYYLIESEGYLSQDDFKNWILAEAYERTVEEWNSHNNANVKQYTTVNFPYVSQVEEGVIGFALETVGISLQRERMASQSGGVKLDDKQRADFYLQQARQFIARYRDWVAFTIEKLNLERGFGVI